MRLSRTAVAAAAAGALLATGCTGGGAEADPEPRIPSSSPAEPSPSEHTASEQPDEAPVMPEAAKERSDDGVRAFLGYWAEALTYSLNTGDTTPLDDVSDPGCDSCNGGNDFLADVYEGGGSVEHGGWTVRQVVFGPDMASPLAKFDRGREIVRRSGESPTRTPAGISTLEFRLRWTDGTWTIEQFTQRD